MYRYTVEEEAPFTINLYNSEVNDEQPFIYQPHEPSGRDWASKEEAETWAQGWIDSVAYAEANPLTEEELLIENLAHMGITVDKLKSVLGLN